MRAVIAQLHQFNEYPSNSTITRLFNDYGGTESRNPRKKHKTPLQNCSAAGFTYALKQPKSLILSGFRA